jgi:gamma-glutamyltranspeptidase/glutathione hydrolase
MLVKDAIEYAENGFLITPYMADVLFTYNEKLSYFEETKEIFQKDYPNFKNKRLFQKDLAKTLKIISKKGRDGFYEGEIAEKIDLDMRKNGGLISKTDLKNYYPVWREPLISEYRNNKIITMGPPSSGGVHIIQMLNILEHYDLENLGHNSSKYINLLAEVLKHAYADRSKYLGDPDFNNVPIKELTSKGYAKNIKEKISLGISVPSKIIKPGMYLDHESHETTHFSVADKLGNIVSSTYTLNSTFGSGVVIENTGIVMNNEMDDFSAAPGIPNQFGLLGAKANEITPNKRPLSSMTPTIVMKENDLFFTTGSPGGARIISAVLQSILNIIDFQMNLEEATFAKRIHHQWQPDVLEIEYSINDKLKKELSDMKYNIDVKDPLTCIQTIMFQDNKYFGYGDFRRPDAFASGNIND